MPYVAGDVMVTVTGTLSSSEEWANVWSFKDVAGDTEAQAVVDALHAFYTSVGDDFWTTATSAVNASYRWLDGSGTFPASWTTITGDTATDLLPTECALRLSIRTLPEASRGGPFLAGFGVQTIEPDGTFTPALQTTLQGYVQTLVDDVDAVPATFGLNSPTVPEVKAASSIRIGAVFDAIRARRRDIPEAYVLVNI